METRSAPPHAPQEAASDQSFWARLASMARWMDEQDGEEDQ